MDYLITLQTLRERVPQWLNTFACKFSDYSVVCLIIATAVIYWCFDKKNGAKILLGYCAAYGFNQTIKNIACVSRPWILDERLSVHPDALKTATGYSFPSGHTTSTASILFGISVWKKDRIWVKVLNTFLILLLAFTRNWVGAHTFPDVFAAVIFSAIMVCFVNLIMNFIEKNPELDILFTVISAIFSILLFLILIFKPYKTVLDANGTVLVEKYYMLTDCYSALGFITGFLVGWILERRFLNFDLNVSGRKKVLRICIGVIITMVIYAGFSILSGVMDYNISHLLKYFCIMFNILYLAPVIFTKFTSRN